MTHTARRPPHPAVWTLLYIPYGAPGGFVMVALTFLATQHGLSITEGALLYGAQMLIHWLKWLWAPIVDITLTPRRWYLVSTTLSAAGVVAMAVIPMSQGTLGLLLGVVAAAGLADSVVGMSVEAMMAGVIPTAEIARAGGWLQAGALGGAGLGGGLGLILMKRLPAPWMAGAAVAALCMVCCVALAGIPGSPPRARGEGPGAAVRGVLHDVATLARTRGGRLTALLCFLPMGTGAAHAVVTQAAVAARWGADATKVAEVQGFASGGITAAGCFVGGWLCGRLRPRTAYTVVCSAHACIAAGMALSPRTVGSYVAWSFAYAFGVGLTYAGFTAVALHAMGQGAAATKYNLFASLSNFPVWWLGLLLGRVADRRGPTAMLLVEAAIGLSAVLLFTCVVRRFERKERDRLAVPVPALEETPAQT